MGRARSSKGLRRSRRGAQGSRHAHCRAPAAFWALFLVGIFGIVTHNCFAQHKDDLQFTFDLAAQGQPLPRIFTPSIDLSGRGFHQEKSWPQGAAAMEALDTWGKEIGFKGFYRLQYNLWEIHELARDPAAQEALLKNYESIIKRVNDAGGVVILDIFGTPAGLGKVLDKRSMPADIAAYKELVIQAVRRLSCQKKYNIWYELWNSPDLDNFFLGSKQEYLALYRAVSRGIGELERQSHMRIPLGGPGASWWFQNFDNNTIAVPERSLVYEFIKYCYHYRLKLDFISWHSYTSDPKADLDMTIYRKTAVALMRDWLSYFHFDSALPLIVEEWNYDDGVYMSAPRGEKSYIAASYIPARLMMMYRAGIDSGLYYCLEDFHDNTDGVVRNLGVFSFDQGVGQYQGRAKASFNAMKMLGSLGGELVRIPEPMDDEFVGAIATRNPEQAVLLVYNYIDPNIVNSYLSRNIGTLREGERVILLNLIKGKKIDPILRREVPLRKVSLTLRLRALFKNVMGFNDKADLMRTVPRTVGVTFKNFKGRNSFKRYVIDSSCSYACVFNPVEEKILDGQELYEEKLKLAPYSVQLIVIQKQPQEPAAFVQEKPASSDKDAATLVLPLQAAIPAGKAAGNTTLTP